MTMPILNGAQNDVLSLLASGVILALVTSVITEKRFFSPSAQLLPYAKYIIIIGYIALERRASRGRRKLSKLGSQLVWSIGALSVVAYCLYCAGFALAGAGLGIGMHAATGQTFTALLSRIILKRKLTYTQILAVVVVNAGLLLRSLAPQQGTSSAVSSSGFQGASTAQILGGSAIVGSSICYGLLGVVFDYLLKVEQPAPPYSQIMEVEGWLGLSVLTLWQAVFTIPNWDSEIAKPLAGSGVSFPAAAGLLLASGCIFIWHYYNMTNMFKTSGAVAVGLVNAVRGAIVSLLGGWLHCTPLRRDQCNSFWTVASALVVMLGALLWVAGTPSKGKPPERNDFSAVKQAKTQ